MNKKEIMDKLKNEKCQNCGHDLLLKESSPDNKITLEHKIYKLSYSEMKRICGKKLRVNDVKGICGCDSPQLDKEKYGIVGLKNRYWNNRIIRPKDLKKLEKKVVKIG